MTWTKVKVKLSFKPKNHGMKEQSEWK